MDNQILVIQLQAVDAHKILWLSQREAIDGKIYNEDWARIAQEIYECLEAQRRGEFFQCAACQQG